MSHTIGYVHKTLHNVSSCSNDKEKVYIWRISKLANRYFLNGLDIFKNKEHIKNLFQNRDCDKRDNYEWLCNLLNDYTINGDKINIVNIRARYISLEFNIINIEFIINTLNKIFIKDCCDIITTYIK